MNRLLALLLVLWCSWAGAQAAGADSSAPLVNPSVEEMVRALTPTAATRSLGRRNLTVAPPRLDLVVNFDFDSARLQAPSKPLLDRLAMAMNAEALSGLRFAIEGHTDAVGTAPYNERLSAQRAQTVLQWLVSRGVPTGRLESEGKGFRELLVSDDPQSPRNRRVRVRLLE